MSSIDDAPNGSAGHDEKDGAGICESPQEMSDVSSDDHSTNGDLTQAPAQEEEAPFGQGNISHEENDDDEGDEEEEDSEEEDEEDDDEPALKYVRMGGSIQDLFKKDSASALAISNKLLVSHDMYRSLAHGINRVKTGIRHTCGNCSHTGPLGEPC